ncbi:FAD-dependent oxidoreductase [bacterium]|nr:FAD-dependent oxidoreductase [bacterium]
MQNYKNLLSSLQIGSIELKNRVVMGSMHTSLEEDKNGFEKLAKFYSERVKGGVALIITGGISPNEEGKGAPHFAKLTNDSEVIEHKKVTDEVHKEGGKIIMQILHTGRYAFHKKSVGATDVAASINRFFPPKKLSEIDIYQTVDDYVNSAILAQKAGYDGVEIMGSEGYLLNQFLSTATNNRDDKWGGSFENRVRFPIEVVKKIRKTLIKPFLIVYRVPIIELVPNGISFDEILKFSNLLVDEGVDILNSGVGWHESQIPTIASPVPEAIFSIFSKKLKNSLKQKDFPIIAVNRLSTPEIAEKILVDGCGDLVSIARPLLADPYWVKKVENGEIESIAPCVACNQACLDHVFEGKRVSCLVTPETGYEYDLELNANIIVNRKKNIAVIGAGAAGLSFTFNALKRGHSLKFFEKNSYIGGDILLASKIPGKEPFKNLLKYWEYSLEKNRVYINFNTTISKENKNILDDFDEIVWSTGTKPKIPSIDGIFNKNILNYKEVLENSSVIDGKKVVIIGTGGIGIDIAMYLLFKQPLFDYSNFFKIWGIDEENLSNGGLINKEQSDFFKNSLVNNKNIEITFMQRGKEGLGKKIGKTTGWIYKTVLQNSGVNLISEVKYDKIVEDTIFYNSVDSIQADKIIIATGGESIKADFNIEKPIHYIGGSNSTKNLDAKKSIRDGWRLAQNI